MGCRGDDGGGGAVGMESWSAAPAQQSRASAAPLIVLVAVCAGFVSGSCTATMEGSNTAAVLPAALAAGVALGIGLLFLIITRDRREVWFFAVIGVAAYIAAEFGAWLFGWPISAVLLTFIAGGVVSGIVAGRVFGVPRRAGHGVGALAMGAIMAAAIAVVWGFWTSFEGPVTLLGDGSLLEDKGSSDFNAYRFALIAGIVTPVVSAVGAWLAGYSCRRGEMGYRGYI